MLFSANNCSGTHSILNSLDVSPTSNGQTGDIFSVNCSSGYTAYPAATGNMTCDESNDWINIVSCIGRSKHDSHNLKLGYSFLYIYKYFTSNIQIWIPMEILPLFVVCVQFTSKTPIYFLL